MKLDKKFRVRLRREMKDALGELVSDAEGSAERLLKQLLEDLRHDVLGEARAALRGALGLRLFCGSWEFTETSPLRARIFTSLGEKLDELAREIADGAQDLSTSDRRAIAKAAQEAYANRVMRRAICLVESKADDLLDSEIEALLEEIDV